jgi:LPXTG-site transpeptidase (sortase) family protein
MKTTRVIAILALSLMLISELFAPTAQAAGGMNIQIPAIEVNTSIVPVYIRTFRNGDVTWDVSKLGKRVGHYDGTAPIGHPGNAVLGGHSELVRGTPGVFYKLNQLTPGAEIVVTVDGNELRYTVANVYLVSATDLTPLLPVGHEQITLLTCDMDSYDAKTDLYGRMWVVVANRTG